MIFLNEDLARLREGVGARLSEKRYFHTLAVERCAIALSEMCLPDAESELSAAALLHDITKELSTDEQRILLNEENVVLDKEDFESTGVLHSFTAPIVVKKEFPEFSTQNVLSAIRYHTLGSPEMSLFDEIIFLADFIEDTRIYDSSVKLRKFVWENMRPEEKERNILILHQACIGAIDATIRNLIENKKAINSKNILTRNALLSKI